VAVKNQPVKPTDRNNPKSTSVKDAPADSIGLDYAGVADAFSGSDDNLDSVDEILRQWAEIRPGLDVSPMGIIGRICRLAVLLVKKQNQIFAKYDLDFAAFDVLATLFRSGPTHELTPSQLAHSMMVTPGAVTQRLTRLEDRDLIIRSHSLTDRRVVTVRLTTSGCQMVEAVLPDHLDNEQHLLAEFDPVEREVLASLLRRFMVFEGDMSD